MSSYYAYAQVLQRVMGDELMKEFAPRVSLTVYYGTNLLANGCEFNTSIVGTAPQVLIGGEPNQHYTLAMFDPDGPLPHAPLLPEIITWVVINIPGGGTCDQGAEYLSYVAPNPRTNPRIGVHRVILALYKQPAPLIGINGVACREHFRTHHFANQHNLGVPVAVAYYNVRR